MLEPIIRRRTTMTNIALTTVFVAALYLSWGAALYAKFSM